MTHALAHRAPALAVEAAPARDPMRAALATLRAWQQRAALRHHLARLDDRLAADVGLDRAALAAEAAKPFWRA